MAIATVLVHAVECKTQRIRKELHSGKLDLRLVALVVAVAVHVLGRYGKVIEITEIFRTHGEQLRIYPDKPNRRSVHESWRGVDIVVRGLGEKEYQQIRDWVNHRWPYGKKRYKTCKFHDVGLGPHLHLQARPL